MSWYRRLAQQQYLFDNVPFDANDYQWWGTIKDDLEFWQGQDFTPVFQHYGVKPNQLDLNGEKIWVFDYNNDKWVFDGNTVAEANNWIYSIHDPSNYITLRDFNADFWNDVGDGSILYHGTPQENLDTIRKSGLRMMDKTRGIANNSTGAAIFTSSNPETVAIYGKPIAIDVGAMKRDGYMPTVAPEGPIEEKQAYEALAHKLGLDNFNHEVESGIEEDTVVFYGNIPAKYLKF
jgi:hypothetical protein